MWSPLEVFNPAPSARGDLQENANPGKTSLKIFPSQKNLKFFPFLFSLFARIYFSPFFSPLCFIAHNFIVLSLSK